MEYRDIRFCFRRRDGPQDPAKIDERYSVEIIGLVI